MKTAKSAGGVIVSPTHNQWYVLIIKDMNETWTFPKGLIEKGERPRETAAREAREEVGITELKLIAPIGPIEYVYTRNGPVKKTVYYFVFISNKRIKLTPQKEEGISAAKWIPFDQAIDMIGYRETNVPLLEETWKLLQLRTYKN